MFKRLLDITASFWGLLVLSPFMLTLALLICLKLGRPVFFMQERAGRQGKSFRLIKFRTLTNARDKKEVLLPKKQRQTRFGNFLRSTSMDELPELFNVLKGEMSLVGPRPLLVEYLPLYNDFQLRRHELKPGITGWAQVNGRNAISWEQKFEYDVWYVDHSSFRLDVKILWMTALKVFGREGITATDGYWTEPFKGEKF